jgi:hypothetical protein
MQIISEMGTQGHLLIIERNNNFRKYEDGHYVFHEEENINYS